MWSKCFGCSLAYEWSSSNKADLMDGCEVTISCPLMTMIRSYSCAVNKLFLFLMFFCDVLLFAARNAWDCTTASGRGVESSTATSSICKFIVKLRALASEIPLKGREPFLTEVRWWMKKLLGQATDWGQCFMFPSVL